MKLVILFTLLAVAAASYISPYYHGNTYSAFSGNRFGSNLQNFNSGFHGRFRGGYNNAFHGLQGGFSGGYERFGFSGGRGFGRFNRGGYGGGCYSGYCR